MFMPGISRWLRLSAPILLLLAGPSGLFCGVAAATSAPSAAPAKMMDCERSMPGDPAPDRKGPPGDAVCRAPCVMVVPAVAVEPHATAVAIFVTPRPARALTGLRDPPASPPPRAA